MLTIPSLKFLPGCNQPLWGADLVRWIDLDRVPWMDLLSSLSFHLGPEALGASLPVHHLPSLEWYYETVPRAFVIGIYCFTFAHIFYNTLPKYTPSWSVQSHYLVFMNWSVYRRIMTISKITIFFVPTCSTPRTMSRSTFLIVSPVASSCHHPWKNIMMIWQAPGSGKIIPNSYRYNLRHLTR